jgi:hypothetical protein
MSSIEIVRDDGYIVSPPPVFVYRTSGNQRTKVGELHGATRVSMELNDDGSTLVKGEGRTVDGDYIQTGQVIVPRSR